LLAFLRRQAGEGVVRVAVFKLLVAGPPGQGKTSLLQRLRETAEASALEEAVQAWAPLDTQMTDVGDGEVAMAAFCLDTRAREGQAQQGAGPRAQQGGGAGAGAAGDQPRGEEAGAAPAVEARTWDCGGQEVFKHTNRIFFGRRRTVHAAVCNLRTGITSEFKDALHDVRCYAPDAPVVLVGTHLDNKEEDPAAVEELLANVSSAAPSWA
jgi:GTPase SAR1 family protein